MNYFNPLNVLNLLKREYEEKYPAETEIFRKEEILKDRLKGGYVVIYFFLCFIFKSIKFLSFVLLTEIIDNYCDGKDGEVEIEEDLCIENEPPELTAEIINNIYESEPYQEDVYDAPPSKDSNLYEENLKGSQSTESQSSHEFYMPPSPKRTREYVPFQYKKDAVQYWRTGSKKGNLLKFSTVKTKYGKLKSLEMLKSWHKQVKASADRRDKLYDIYEHTYRVFCDAKEQKLIVHDINLRRWAITRAREINMNNFTASKWFLYKFKNIFNIVSRKITRFVNKATSSCQEEIRENGHKFVIEVREEMDTIGKENTFNTDQFGMNLEIHSGRTLEEKGVKSVEALVQSVNATTHSYTLQATISAAGKVLPKMYMCLQTKDGTFGPIVTANLPKDTPNIVLKASTSGKLGKHLVREYYDEIYCPLVPGQSILLQDSWGGQTDRQLLYDVTRKYGNDVTLKILPKHTTGFAQPCDVNFHRQYKDFVRKFTEMAMLEGHEIVFHQRNNIIYLNSHAHTEFSCPRYQAMISYAWYAPGYIDEHPPDYDTPAQFCFKFNGEKCMIRRCRNYMFLRCSWCRIELCFDHYFKKHLNCSTFVE